MKYESPLLVSTSSMNSQVGSLYCGLNLVWAVNIAYAAHVLVAQFAGVVIILAAGLAYWVCVAGAFCKSYYMIPSGSRRYC